MHILASDPSKSSWQEYWYNSKVHLVEMKVERSLVYVCTHREKPLYSSTWQGSHPVPMCPVLSTNFLQSHYQSFPLSSFYTTKELILCGFVLTSQVCVPSSGLYLGYWIWTHHAWVASYWVHCTLAFLSSFGLFTNHPVYVTLCPELCLLLSDGQAHVYGFWDPQPSHQ